MVAALLIAASVSALAAGEPTTPAATITVSGITEGNTLKLYKVADAVVGADNAIHYTFVTSPTLPAAYDSVEELAAITTNSDDANAMALAYAGIFGGTDATISKANQEGEGDTVTINNVPAGLYFAIVSGNKDTGVVYKSMFFNAAPVANSSNGYDGASVSYAVKKETVTIAKTEYDPASEGYAKTTDGYSRGDTIPFHIDTLIPNYPSNSTHATFTITDTPTGLEDTVDSVKVFVGGTDAEKEVAKGADTWSVAAADDGFVITFVQDYILANAGKTVQVQYNSVLTAPSVTSGDTTNTATITYNPNPYEETTVTPPDTDEQHTYGLVFEKVDDSTPAKPLAGAVFALYDENGTNAITQNGTALTFTTVVNDYTVNGATEKHAYVYWDGLKAGTYTIKETSAPAGFVPCAEFKMTVGASVSTSNNPATDTTEDNYTVAATAAVNNHGSQLPSTGGIGTTIFYIAGSILVLGAAILLITKRRMGAND